MSWTLWNVWTLWLKDMLNVWCILNIFDLYCLRQVLVKPTQTWTTESAKKLSQFLELLLSAKWTTAKLVLGAHWRDCFTSHATSLGATKNSVAPSDVARLAKQSRQWRPKNSFAASHLSNKSCAKLRGATQLWVVPRHMAWFMKQSRQMKPQFSTVVVHFPDKIIWEIG
jgi:hypothetical protein